MHSEELDEEPDIQTVVGTFNWTEPRKKPEFTKPKKMHRIQVKPAGNMVNLKCQAEGNPQPNITWIKDGSPFYRRLGQAEYRKWSLILENLITDDAGNYTCIVCNTEGCINFTFVVDVMGEFEFALFLSLSPPPALPQASKNSTFILT